MEVVISVFVDYDIQDIMGYFESGKEVLNKALSYVFPMR
jgi:hypothetical protein